MYPALAFSVQRFKLKYDEPPSSFAFNFNLRRYTTDMAEHFNAVGQFKTKLAGNNERVKRISAITPLDKGQSIVRPAIIHVHHLTSVLYGQTTHTSPARFW